MSKNSRKLPPSERSNRQSSGPEHLAHWVALHVGEWQAAYNIAAANGYANHVVMASPRGVKDFEILLDYPANPLDRSITPFHSSPAPILRSCQPVMKPCRFRSDRCSSSSSRRASSLCE